MAASVDGDDEDVVSPLGSSSSSRPACDSSVSADTLRARAMERSTRTEGSWRPRSIWLKYGLETLVRSASSRSESWASLRCERMRLPSDSSCDFHGSASTTPPTVSEEKEMTRLRCRAISGDCWMDDV